VRANNASLSDKENIDRVPHHPSAEAALSGVAAYTIYNAIAGARTSEDLDRLARTLWGGYTEGAINDEDAALLQSCIDRRRAGPPNARPSAVGHALGRLAGRVERRFGSRQHPRSPDRKASRDRRRMLGGSAVMPPNLRPLYTEGQRAVLCIVAGEVKHRGVCDLPVDKIAALAGVCRTTVQTTLHEARLLFHIKVTERPRPGRKNLTNVIEITSAEWSNWIKRGAHRPIGSSSVKIVSPTKIVEIESTSAVFVERPQEARRGVQGGPAGPSRTGSEPRPRGALASITSRPTKQRA
jgi:hypothetical protein